MVQMCCVGLLRRPSTHQSPHGGLASPGRFNRPDTRWGHAVTAPEMVTRDAEGGVPPPVYPVLQPPISRRNLIRSAAGLSVAGAVLGPGLFTAEAFAPGGLLSSAAAATTTHVALSRAAFEQAIGDSFTVRSRTCTQIMRLDSVQSLSGMAAGEPAEGESAGEPAAGESAGKSARESAAGKSAGQSVASESSDAQFALIFASDHPSQLDQGTYGFRHRTIGAFPLFIVPMAAVGDPRRYEAIVNCR